MLGCCHRMSLETGFWLVATVAFTLTTFLLVLFELPWVSKDPVTPVYDIETMKKVMNMTYTFKPVVDSDIEFSYYDVLFLSLFRAVAEESENLFREQYVRDWRGIVNQMVNTRGLYKNHWQSLGSQEKEYVLFDTLLSFYQANRGPYDMLQEYKGFIESTYKASFPDIMKTGHNLYTDSLDESNWYDFVNNNPAGDELNQEYEEAVNKYNEAKKKYDECLSSHVEASSCKNKEDVVKEAQEGVTDASDNINSYNEEKKSWTSPYTVLGTVIENKFSLDVTSFAYDVEFAGWIKSILNGLLKIKESGWDPYNQEIWDYLNALIYLHTEQTEEEVNGEITTGDVFAEKMKDAITAWCKIQVPSASIRSSSTSNLEFFLGPNNYGFDQLGGIKRFWSAYAGIIDTTNTELANKYSNYISTINYNYKPALAPAIHCINVLIEQEGRVGPPKTLSFMAPPVEDIMTIDDYYKAKVIPKSFVLVNEIEAMYENILKGIVRYLGFKESKYHTSAYVQLFVSQEVGRLAGLNLISSSDASERYKTTKDTFAVNYVKSILSAIRDTYTASQYGEQLMQCKVNADDETPDLPLCSDYAWLVAEVGIAQLVQLLQFGSNTPYAVYARYALWKLKGDNAITIPDNTNICNISFSEQPEWDRMVSSIDTIIKQLATTEGKGTAPADLDKATILDDCYSLLSTSKYRTILLEPLVL